MKYMLKKIIIGVSIGLILLLFKTKVYADNYYYNNFDNIVVDYAFDVCLKTGTDFICTEGLEGTTDIRGLLNNYVIYSTKDNEYLMLKKFNVKLVFKSDLSVIMSNYQVKLPDTAGFFTGLKTNLLLYNNTVSYVEYYKRNDVNPYIPNDYGQILSNYGVSGSGTQYYLSSPYFKTLNTNIALTEIDYVLQNGYTYNGPMSIIGPVPQFSTLPSRDTFIQQYKNNTYLGFVEPNTTLTLLRQPSSGNWTLTTNQNYSSWANYDHVSTTQQQINENLSSLNKEIVMSQVFIGSDEFSSTESDLANSSLTSIIASGSSSISSFHFTDFINALITKPVQLLTDSTEHDFYSTDGGYHLTGDLCFSSFSQGGTNRGFVKIPFKNTGSYFNDYFQFPCLTRDIYTKFSGGGFSIVGSSSLVDTDGTTIGMNGASFLSIWLIIQHGVLFYLLAVNFVAIVKYCIDTKDAEIEVLEL